MMKNLLLRKFFPILLGMLFCVSWAEARDVYVSLNGTGSGADAANPMSFTTLLSTTGPLRTHNVTNDGNELNVYFEAGTYPVNATNYFQFSPTAANVSGLNVTFQPTDESADRSTVVFDGGSTVTRAVRTTAGDANGNMSVSFSNVTFQNFTSAADAVDGTSSLFTPMTYTTITLDNVHVNNVRSTRMPLVSIYAYATFNVQGGSRIERVLINSTSAYGLYETERGYETFNINNAEFVECGNQATTTRAWGHMFWMENDYNVLSINNAVFSNNTVPNSIIASSIATNDITITDSQFLNNTMIGTTDRGIIVWLGNARNFTVTDCTFSGNNATGTASSALFDIDEVGALEIGGSTFTGTNVQSGVNLMTIAGVGSRLIYNNTFSGNTFTGPTYGTGISLTVSTVGGIFNNTFYNSNGIYVGSNMNVLNNLIVGSGAALNGISTALAGYVKRNVIGNVFYTTSNSGSGIDIPNAISYLTLLQNNAVSGKPQVHNLILSDTDPSRPNPFLTLGESASDTGYGDRLAYDQNGNNRPSRISVGSIDDPVFELPAKLDYKYVYDEQEGLNNRTIRIDLSDMSLPAGATPETVTYTLNPISNGTLTPTATPYIFEFYPLTDSGDPNKVDPSILGIIASTTYNVSYTNPTTNITYTANGLLNITVTGNTEEMPLGMIDESTVRCFTNFEAVTFNAGVKFYTGNTNINPSGNRNDAFAIPLVGDLNGDGKPEIVIISQENNAAEAYSEYIYIFNGQTGKIILKHALPVRTMTRGDGYHGTPSSMLLMDSDRNGRGEILVAMGYNTTSGGKNWDSRLICYEVNERTFASEGITGTSPTAANRLSMKWVSEKRYDWVEQNFAGSTACNFNFTVQLESGPKNIVDNTGRCFDSRYYFKTPLPQVVDFNGDGTPEIFVYNKIYNAVDGELIMKLEELGPASSYGSSGDYVDYRYENINNYAFVGRDRTARHSGGTGAGDTNVPYAYIYDLDKDGRYDIAAGGKVYYNIDLDAKTYDVIKDVPTYPGSSSYLIDGHTGVADINSDGIAEVVVLTRTPGGGSSESNPLLITVWNPGFFKLAADGVTVEEVTGAPQPEVVARIEIPISYTGFGNHSYIFISDIDGLEQEVTLPSGETVRKKYPEISVLSGRMYSSSSNNVPLHPNVAASLSPKLADGSGSNKYINYGGSGSIISFTWDGVATTYSDRLKASFILLHTDNSCNTAFTLFDFDNDGKMDICYRDLDRLRIISAEAPYYVASDDETSQQNPLIKFSIDLESHTGFECPVVADIDGDASADMVVTGYSSRRYNDYIYAVQGEGVQFAPAPKVWNQFMYSPLKVNEDLTIPSKVFDPLSDEFAFAKEADPDYVKDYIYNNTVTQTAMYSTFIREVNGENFDVWEPVVKQPDAVVSSSINIDQSRLEITIQNTGSSTLNATNPVLIYRDVIQGGTITSTNYLTSTTVGTDVFPGESVTVYVTVADPYRDYAIRVSDASRNSGSFDPTKWEDVYLECNWADNIAYASNLQANDDGRVVEPYKTITFNVLDNDMYPNTCTPVVTFTLPSGTDWGSATTTNNGVVTYTAPATYPGGVVEFDYTITCGNTKSGKVYIYILENSTGSFAACYGETLTINLKEQPSGTTFNWYTDASGTTSRPEVTEIPNMIANQTLFVRPIVSGYSAGLFPIYPLTVYAVGGSSDNANMRWTGSVSTDWSDPNNWQVEGAGGVYGAVQYAPTKCVDVEIPKVTTNYPTLLSTGQAGHINIQDRAMLANTHKLDYDSASISVNFTAAERNNRWVMYSAPMRKVYSGDFILFDDQGNPKTSPPAVYMSLFQSQHPDRPEVTAQEKRFTDTFGNVGVLLYLGKSFNVWINKDVDTDTPFSFPSKQEKYDYYVHGNWGTEQTGDSSSQTLDRYEGAVKVSGQFIADEAKSNAVYNYNPTDGSFELPPPDDKAEFQMIMVPNPYMAYLDMEAFLLENAAVLQQGYKIWKGQDDSFISFHQVPVWKDRVWVIDDADILSSGKNDLDSYRYAAPFQSFIVSKNTSSMNQTVRLKYKPETMLTTAPSGITGDYQLRSATDEEETEGLMSITAGFMDKTNTTLLANSPGASNSFTDDDSPKLFFDGRSPVSVYTLTPEKEALAINVSGEFKGKEIPVGVRLNGQGKLTFDFSGIRNFKYEALFVDGSKEIDLSKTTTYTTEDVVNTSGKFIEFNNRFKLRFGDATTGMDESWSQAIHITTRNGNIEVTSDATMNAVEVVTVLGALTYKSETSGNRYIIPVEGGQVYVVKVITDKGTEVRKVIVR